MQNIENLLTLTNLFYKKALLVTDIATGPHKAIIAYKANIWLLDNDLAYSNKSIEILTEQQQEKFNEIANELSLKDYGSWLTTFSDLIDYIRDHRPDVLIGFVDLNKKTLFIDTPSAFQFSPHSSILVKKIVKQLNIKEVSMNVLRS